MPFGKFRGQNHLSNADVNVRVWKTIANEYRKSLLTAAYNERDNAKKLYEEAKTDFESITKLKNPRESLEFEEARLIIIRTDDNPRKPRDRQIVMEYRKCVAKYDYLVGLKLLTPQGKKAYDALVSAKQALKDAQKRLNEAHGEAY